jgi:hypothetical protein
MGHILANLNPLTQYAIVFVSLVGIYFHVVWSRRSTILGPTLLTTLGIFFCFLGIALGLADFDPNDVKVSVPHLLQGIRTSFWVSVCGIGWALTIKIRLMIFGDAKAPAAVSENATIDDLAAHLSQLNEAVADSGEGSLVSQIKLLRANNNERLEQLHSALESHAQRTAEANARVLIQALSEVVHNFNSKLNEQFGENFKELNAGVGRLVTWQQQYEEQLNKLIETEAASTQTMAEASSRYSDLIAKSGEFVSTTESLGSLLGKLDVEREQLTNGLQNLSGVIDKAAHNLPKIEEKIADMTAQISRGVQANQEALGAVLKSSWQSIQVHNQHLTAMLAKSLEAANRDVGAHARLTADAKSM